MFSKKTGCPPWGVQKIPVEKQKLLMRFQWTPTTHHLMRSCRLTCCIACYSQILSCRLLVENLIVVDFECHRTAVIIFMGPQISKYPLFPYHSHENIIRNNLNAKLVEMGVRVTIKSMETHYQPPTIKLSIQTNHVCMQKIHYPSS